MVNRYMRGAHLKERKFKAVLRCFCEDLEALQTASLTHLNRNTINTLFKKFRERIMELAERERIINAMLVQVDESWFGTSRKRGSWFCFPTIVFGMISNEGKVYTEIIGKVCKADIMPIIRRCCTYGATILSDAAPVYKGLSGMRYRHSSVNHSLGEFSRGRITTNSIESYWSWAKLRLSKFKGIKADSVQIHLKECEWRFNHRHEDIYMLLLSSFRSVPI